MGVLSAAQRDQFLEDGFVLVEDAFDRDVAEQCVGAVWEAVGCHARGASSPDRPAVWSDNFVHLQYGFRDGPFASVATPRVLATLDDLLGAGRWTWDQSFGWWPVLFPGFGAGRSTRDLGWHVDSDDSHPTLRVPEKAVVSLFYFSDAESGDGGTAVLPGSHATIARLLAEVEPLALNHESVRTRIPLPSTDDDVVEVVAHAGDVLFAHPFLVHASNRNVGDRVRFACNPHVDLLGSLDFVAPEHELSLVEQAIARALL